jgi:hypothetical protein
MGLDMYLTAEKFFYTYKDEQEIDTTIKHISGIEDLTTDDFSSMLRLPIIYWRKANAIHNWFVNNVQDGKDDCGTYNVSFDQLEELQEAISEVINGTPPEEVLPAIPGFLFGSTDYNDWYYQDLRKTEEKLNKLISQKEKLRGWSFYYHSSW